MGYHCPCPSKKMKFIPPECRAGTNGPGDMLLGPIKYPSVKEKVSFSLSERKIVWAGSAAILRL
jgi:hypothetical protein